MAIKFENYYDDEYFKTVNGMQIEKLFRKQAEGCKPYYSASYPASIANIVTDSRLDYFTEDKKIINVNAYLLTYYIVSVVLRNLNRKDILNIKGYVRWLRYLRKRFYPNYSCAINNSNRKFISVHGLYKSTTIEGLVNFINPGLTRNAKDLLKHALAEVDKYIDK